jgi:cold shock CspA family protein
MRQTGRVFQVNENKRFGFIVSDGHYKFFFHERDVIGKLLPAKDTHVSFDVIKQPPGSSQRDRAVNVQIEAVPQ